MTQAEKVLQKLKEANGEWVNGRYFLHTMFLSQYHARIFDLQKKGYEIESSDFTDEHGFKSYRLIGTKAPIITQDTSFTPRTIDVPPKQLNMRI